MSTIPNDAEQVVYALKLEDGRRWREAATDWQVADAAAVLAPDDSDPRLNWLSRPKGGSKSTDLAAFCIAWLAGQAPALAEGFAVAADEEQANRLLDKARGFVARTPELQGLVKVEAKRIVGPNGARVQALAADVAGSEGLLTPWIVVDELTNWATTKAARAMWTSVVSALPKWAGCRLTVIGHAGDPAHWSYRLLRHARTSTAWNVHEIDGPLEWVSTEALDEQRQLLLPSEFARRHLNQWTASEDRLSSPDELRRCVTHEGDLLPQPNQHYVLGLDLGVKHDSTVLTVCHADGSGDERHVVVDMVRAFVPTKTEQVDLAVVEEAVATASAQYNRARVVFDPWQALLLARNLRTRGIRTEEFVFSATSVGRIAATLFNLLANRRIHLPDDTELLDELANVRLRETTPGVVRMDHDSDRHDDRAVSLALAAHALIATPVSGAQTYFDALATEQADRGRKFDALGRPLATHDEATMLGFTQDEWLGASTGRAGSSAGNDGS